MTAPLIALRRVVPWLYGALFSLVLGYYGTVHWRVLWLAEPATVRETALTADVNGFLANDAARPYTLESIPGRTNLYGIGYLWVAAPFVEVLPFTSTVDLRIGNAVLLLVLLGLIAWGRTAKWNVYGTFALLLVYALYVSSPSVAAAPDIAGCVWYVLAYVVVARRNFGRWALGASVVFGFLALLTKPYLVLVVPAIASYLLLFRSVRAAANYTLLVGIVFGVGLMLVARVYPYYFISVFAVHLGAVFRDPLIALQQWREFILLAAVPSVGGAVGAWMWWRKKPAGIRFQCHWSDPLITGCRPVTIYGWGAVVAATALAASLAWHTGAHLIYFWHLLLPLLVLQEPPRILLHRGCLAANLALLLVWRPPLPPGESSHEWRQLQAFIATKPRVYLDPYLQALRPDELGRPDVANAQSDYLLGLAIAGGDVGGAEDKAEMIARSLAGQSPTLRNFAQAYVIRDKRAFARAEYDAVLLTERIFYQEHVMPEIRRNYQITSVQQLYPYYFSFRDRTTFGLIPLRIFVFERISKASAAVSP
jgi:hypothetical protein